MTAEDGKRGEERLKKGAKANHDLAPKDSKAKPESERGRLARPERPRLEALLDERDHIRIRISLQSNDEERDEPSIAALHKQLDSLDRHIAEIERGSRYT
jgi:hypothetical protein